VQITDEQKKRIEEITKLISEEGKKEIGDIASAKFYKGKGCDACQGIGYKGRVGIYEIMIMNENIEKLIQEEKLSEYNFAKIAIENGMITMAQDGIIKAIKGETTIEEVLRVAE